MDGGVSPSTWDVGEDCWLDGEALRFMDEPSTDGSSRDHYSARYTGSADNGGVHWNSGIANHFFYLLSEGGTHHNSAYADGGVNGIGIDDAYQIWYRALDLYMNSSTNFSGARTATENACSDLYGASSSNCVAVGDAWDEVGVDGGSSGGGGSFTCPSGYTTITDSLSAGGSHTYTYSTLNTSHDFILNGADGTDFDLYLYRGGRLRQSSTSASSYEEIHYNGTANKLIVRSYSGSGAYTLCYNL